MRRGRRLLSALPVLAAVLAGCTGLPRTPEVESADAALRAARQAAADGHWGRARRLLESAERRDPRDERLAAMRERLERRWAARRQRLEDQLLAVRARAAQDEIALLEPLVRAEPQRAWLALQLEWVRRELAGRRGELIGCARRQLESDLILARRCALLAARIEAGEDAADLVDRIDARLAERYAEREAGVEARAERRQRSRIEASIERAEADLAAGNLAEAADRLDRVLAADPDNAVARRRRADLAETTAERSRVLNELAARLYLEGQIDPAIRVWRASLGLAPEQPEVRERLQRARRVSERLEELRDAEVGRERPRAVQQDDPDAVQQEDPDAAPP